MATRDEIKTVIRMLSHLPNCPLQPGADVDSQRANKVIIDLFELQLRDIPFEYLQGAVLQYTGQDKPFFPSNPGTLRELAFDIEMIAQGIPTASQAWAMVMRGPSRIEARICEKGHELRMNTDPTSKTYWRMIGEIADHEKVCDICMPASRDGSYGSKTVDEVVRLMGGRAVIFTDNAVSDRARFIESYRELVFIERQRLQLHPQVQELIGNPDRPALGTPGESMRLLAAKMGG